MSASTDEEIEKRKQKYIEDIRDPGRYLTEIAHRKAQALIERVFEVVDHKWRGIGVIPRSGLRLKGAYARFDATRAFELETVSASEVESVCIAGLILRGIRRPVDCPAFGSECTPEHCLGAPMVSSEGASAAYYQHRRRH
jgi:hydrogenase expression/formation protein HypD